MGYLQTLLGDAYTEGMSIEDIDAALESAGIGAKQPVTDLEREVSKLKQQLSKANTEAANYRKKLSEKQTEEERKAAEDAEKWAQLEENYNTLLREKTLADHKSQLLALGYTAELAIETAQAMVDGDSAKVFANQQKAFELKEKAIKAEILKNAPRPEIKGGGNAEDISKMSITEKMKLKAEDPQRFNELSGAQ